MSDSPPALDPEFVADLRCPLTRRPLVLVDNRLLCYESRKAYRIDDGIPVLLIEEAEDLDDSEVPEEFRAVSEASGMTVQLTAVGARADLWIESESLERIVVKGEKDVKFHYFVNGVRKGFRGITTQIPNDVLVPTVRGVPWGKNLPVAYRQLLVENGILNPDFTPNEATAAGMGWVLVDPEPQSFDGALSQSR